MNSTIQTLTTELQEVLTARGFNANYSDTYLQYEIKRAIGTINRCRNFTSTDKQPFDAKYEHLIIPMCVAAIAKMGAEGQSSHSENGISRTYSSGDDYPKELLSQIVPLIK